VAVSGLWGKDKETGKYTICCGYGLFAGKQYALVEKIAEFIGEFIRHDEYERRTRAGCSGYMIKLKKGKKVLGPGDEVTYPEAEYLDCFANCKAKSCKASYANSPLEARWKNKRQTYTANAELIVRKRTRNTWHVYLKALGTV
jgi:hypothetical protein